MTILRGGALRSILFGSVALFWLLFFGFLRWIPSVPIHEVKHDRFEQLEELAEAQG